MVIRKSERSDIKSLLPGEDLNDKVCNRKLKTAPQECTLTFKC